MTTKVMSTAPISQPQPIMLYPYPHMVASLGMPLFVINTTALFSLSGHVIFGAILGLVAVRMGMLSVWWTRGHGHASRAEGIRVLGSGGPSS